MTKFKIMIIVSIIESPCYSFLSMISFLLVIWLLPLLCPHILFNNFRSPMFWLSLSPTCNPARPLITAYLKHWTIGFSILLHCSPLAPLPATPNEGARLTEGQGAWDSPGMAQHQGKRQVIQSGEGAEVSVNWLGRQEQEPLSEVGLQWPKHQGSTTLPLQHPHASPPQRLPSNAARWTKSAARATSSL